MMRTKQDNDLIDSTGSVQAKNEIELSWSKWLNAVCEET